MEISDFTIVIIGCGHIRSAIARGVLASNFLRDKKQLHIVENGAAMLFVYGRPRIYSYRSGYTYKGM